VNDVIATFRWRDAVDIVLVAAVMYRVLLMFRGTRAIQMLVGLAFLIAATVVARRLDLASMRWILDNFWSFWVIALVVLFQPELRRALTRIGENRLVRVLSGATGEERAHVVDEVVDAAESLAGRRVGALIVLERGAGLRLFAELGVHLDAVVSADLLVSLFLPASPLHDGAVIVQSTRVVAAGCFLPLSRSLHIGRQLGTRHRAALGITEDSDALAVVVSEETGRISLAVEGQIAHVGDPGELRARLFELLGVAQTPERRASFLAGVRRLLPRPPDNA
jgi:diadenylate cyclase